MGTHQAGAIGLAGSVAEPRLPQLLRDQRHRSTSALVAWLSHEHRGPPGTHYTLQPPELTRAWGTPELRMAMKEKRGLGCLLGKRPFLLVMGALHFCIAGCLCGIWRANVRRNKPRITPRKPPANDTRRLWSRFTSAVKSGLLALELSLLNWSAACWLICLFWISRACDHFQRCPFYRAGDVFLENICVTFLVSSQLRLLISIRTETIFGKGSEKLIGCILKYLISS